MSVCGRRSASTPKGSALRAAAEMVRFVRDARELGVQIVLSEMSVKSPAWTCTQWGGARGA